MRLERRSSHDDLSHHRAIARDEYGMLAHDDAVLRWRSELRPGDDATEYGLLERRQIVRELLLQEPDEVPDLFDPPALEHRRLRAGSGEIVDTPPPVGKMICRDLT